VAEGPKASRVMPDTQVWLEPQEFKVLKGIREQ
jgi:hypothetical protein